MANNVTLNDISLLNDKIRNLDQKLIQMNQETIASFRYEMGESKDKNNTYLIELATKVAKMEDSFIKRKIFEDFRSDTEESLMKHGMELKNNASFAEISFERINKQIRENLEVPGLIGDYGKFKNIGQALVAVLELIDKGQRNYLTFEADVKKMLKENERKFENAQHMAKSAENNYKSYVNSVIAGVKSDLDAKIAGQDASITKLTQMNAIENYNLSEKMAELNRRGIAMSELIAKFEKHNIIEKVDQQKFEFDDKVVSLTEKIEELRTSLEALKKDTKRKTTFDKAPKRKGSDTSRGIEFRSNRSRVRGNTSMSGKSEDKEEELALKSIEKKFLRDEESSNQSRRKVRGRTVTVAKMNLKVDSRFKATKLEIDDTQNKEGLNELSFIKEVKETPTPKETKINYNVDRQTTPFEPVEEESNYDIIKVEAVKPKREFEEVSRQFLKTDVPVLKRKQEQGEGNIKGLRKVGIAVTNSVAKKYSTKDISTQHIKDALFEEHSRTFIKVKQIDGEALESKVRHTRNVPVGIKNATVQGFNMRTANKTQDLSDRTVNELKQFYDDKFKKGMIDGIQLNTKENK